MNSLVEDVRFLAQLGQKHGVKISYEPWCFSPRIPSWEGCWEVCKVVDHPFIGLCIDISHVSPTRVCLDHPTLTCLPPRALTDRPVARLRRLQRPGWDRLHRGPLSSRTRPPARPPCRKDTLLRDLGRPPAQASFATRVCFRRVPPSGSQAESQLHLEHELSNFAAGGQGCRGRRGGGLRSGEGTRAH